MLIGEAAHFFPYKLDIFQKQAILKLDEGYHVLVAAHTGSGKTAVGEYAIAKALKNRKRVIYTSPVKALSNQKYRDFNNTFRDVGILTGDVSTNTKASCVIMTTEILTEMLFSCVDKVTNNLDVVIFDEFHYIGNPERGHVWEQALIMLPKSVQILMLSATVPNAQEFADWLGNIKRKKVYVFSTNKRPVPLRHFVFTGAGGNTTNEMFEVVDTGNNFLHESHKQATLLWQKERPLNKDSYEIKKEYAAPTLTPLAEADMWKNLMQLLQHQNLLPALVFILSRVGCDVAALTVKSMNFTSKDDKNLIKQILKSHLRYLRDEDKQLKQVKAFQRILPCGIGVHHSGVLPLLREIVELLFQKGLLKVIFATETFAVGVNSPARTVVFENHFRGRNDQQLLTASEYTQMAGRAGRRGIDTLGSVVILCKHGVPTEKQLKAMILEAPEPLKSQFKLPYNLILNMLKRGQSVEDLMSNSFLEADLISRRDEYRRKLVALQNELFVINRHPFPEYLIPYLYFYDAAEYFLSVLKDVMLLLFRQPSLVNLMVPGRVLLISKGKFVNQLGVLLHFQVDAEYPCQVLLLDTNIPGIEYGAPEEDLWYRMIGLTKLFLRKGTDQQTLRHVVVHVQAENVLGIMKHVIFVNATEIISQCTASQQILSFDDELQYPSYIDTVQELLTLSNNVYNGSITLNRYNYVQLLNIDQNSEHYEKWDTLRDAWEKVYRRSDALDMQYFYDDFTSIYERKMIENERDKYRYLLSPRNLKMYKEYQNKLKMLKKMKFINDHNRIMFKGHIALCFRNKELAISQLLCNRVLEGKTPEEIIAVLSAFIQPRITNKFPRETALRHGVDSIRRVETKLAQTEFVCGIGNGVPPKCEYGWMTPIYKWASQDPFMEVNDDACTQEGTVVRCIQQLNDLIMRIKRAARVFRNDTLINDLEKASKLIKRNIVVTQSLYLREKPFSVSSFKG